MVSFTQQTHGFLKITCVQCALLLTSRHFTLAPPATVMGLCPAHHRAFPSWPALTCHSWASHPQVFPQALVPVSISQNGWGSSLVPYNAQASGSSLALCASGATLLPAALQAPGFPCTLQNTWFLRHCRRRVETGDPHVGFPPPAPV